MDDVGHVPIVTLVFVASAVLTSLAVVGSLPSLCLSPPYRMAVSNVASLLPFNYSMHLNPSFNMDKYGDWW